VIDRTTYGVYDGRPGFREEREGMEWWQSNVPQKLRFALAVPLSILMFVVLLIIVNLCAFISFFDILCDMYRGKIRNTRIMHYVVDRIL